MLSQKTLTNNLHNILVPRMLLRIFVRSFLRDGSPSLHQRAHYAHATAAPAPPRRSAPTRTRRHGRAYVQICARIMRRRRAHYAHRGARDRAGGPECALCVHVCARSATHALTCAQGAHRLRKLKLLKYFLHLLEIVSKFPV